MRIKSENRSRSFIIWWQLPHWVIRIAVEDVVYLHNDANRIEPIFVHGSIVFGHKNIWFTFSNNSFHAKLSNIISALLFSSFLANSLLYWFSLGFKRASITNKQSTNGSRKRIKLIMQSKQRESKTKSEQIIRRKKRTKQIIVNAEEEHCCKVQRIALEKISSIWFNKEYETNFRRWHF